MTEWKCMNPSSSSSQSSIAAMKKFLADGRLTPLPYTLWRTLRPPRPGVGNVGGRRVHQGNTYPANITTVVEMQSKPLPLSTVCPIRLPFILFYILSIYNSVYISLLHLPHSAFLQVTVEETIYGKYINSPLFRTK